MLITPGSLTASCFLFLTCVGGWVEGGGDWVERGGDWIRVEGDWLMAEGGWEGIKKSNLEGWLG